MNKSLILVAVLFCAIAGGGYYYFSKLSENDSGAHQILFSKNTLCAYKVKDVHESELLPALTNLVNGLFGQFGKVDKETTEGLFSFGKSISDFPGILDEVIYYSIEFTETDHLSQALLIECDLPENGKESLITTLGLKKRQGIDSFNQVVFVGSGNLGNQIFVLFDIDGIRLFSKEKQLRDYLNTDVKNNFFRIQRNVSKTSVFYTRVAYLDWLLVPNYRSVKENSELKESEIIELTTVMNDGNISLGGILFGYEDVGSVNKPIIFKSFNVISSGTVFYTTSVFNEKSDHWPKPSLVDSLSIVLKHDLTKQLINHLGGEFGNGVVFDDSLMRTEVYSLISCSEAKKVRNQLKMMFLEDSSNADTNRIYRMPEKSFSQLFSINTTELDEEYVTVLGNFIAICPSKHTLQALIKSYHEADVFSNSYTFSQNNKLFEQANSHLSFWKNFNNTVTRTSHFNWSQNKSPQFEFVTSSLEKLDSGVYIQLQFVATKEDSKNSNIQLKWEYDFDTTVVWGPYKVYNHHTKSFDYLVVDALNKLFSINSEGVLLWSKELVGIPRGKPFEVDLYKNNKVQYLLSTEQSIYVIDRKGRDVKGYPVDFQSLINTEISVFDFETDRNYQTFVPLIDKQISTINSWGEKIESQFQFKIDTTLNTPVQQIEMGDSSILFAQNMNREIVFKTETGANTFSSITLSTLVRQAFQIFKTDSSVLPQLISFDSSGTVFIIDIEKGAKAIDFGNWSNNVSFAFIDVDEDGRRDFVFCDENRLQTFRSDQTRIFSFVTKEKLKSAMRILSSRPFVAAYLGESACILVNNKGEETARINNLSFPIFVKTQNNNLVVGIGGDKKLQSYKIKI